MVVYKKSNKISKRKKNSNNKVQQIAVTGFTIAGGIFVGLALAGMTAMWFVSVLFGLGFIFSLMELRKNA